jgi:Fe-S-cluster containining protein
MLDDENPVLVPGRDCGDCNVCCVALTIDDPALQKVQGFRCQNTLPDKACAIYESRPRTCRVFFCGYRRLKWVKDTLRPDRSDVLVNLQYENKPGETPVRMGVTFTLLTAAAVKAEGLAESVAAAVSAGVPVYVQIPGPPGFTWAQARIDEALRPAVYARDKAAILRLLQQAHRQGRKGDFEPVKLSGRTPPN